MATEYTAAIAQDWAQNPYYSQAEQWTDAFWHEGSVFFQYFWHLNPKTLLELACGHGRHTARLLESPQLLMLSSKVERVTLVDVNQENIEACKARFSQRGNIDYLVNNGSSLPGIGDESHTALFCYDAMVHFEAEDVIHYLSEIKRVLIPGGRALLHYSNQHWLPGESYRHAPHCRNFFGENMMLHFSQRKGLRPLLHTTMDWGSNPTHRNIDALILLEKPA